MQHSMSTEQRAEIKLFMLHLKLNILGITKG